MVILAPNVYVSGGNSKQAQAVFNIPARSGSFRNLRLMNIDLDYRQAVEDPNQTIYYASKAGACSLIDYFVIYMRESATHTIQDFPYFAAKRLSAINSSTSACVAPQIYGTTGYLYDGDVKRQRPNILSADDNRSATISLGDFIKELNNISFPWWVNMRIEIYYTTLPPTELFVGDVSNDDSYTIKMPYLMYDEGPELDIDSFQINGTTMYYESYNNPYHDVAQEDRSYRAELKGAIDRRVSDVTFAFAPMQTSSLDGTVQYRPADGNFCSIYPYDAELQVYINGDPIFQNAIMDNEKILQMYSRIGNVNQQCLSLTSAKSAFPVLGDDVAESEQFLFLTPVPTDVFPYRVSDVVNLQVLPDEGVFYRTIETVISGDGLVYGVTFDSAPGASNKAIIAGHAMPILPIRNMGTWNSCNYLNVINPKPNDVIRTLSLGIKYKSYLTNGANEVPNPQTSDPAYIGWFRILAFYNCLQKITIPKDMRESIIIS